MNQIIQRPRYSSLPVADAAKADWRGWHLSQKMDGVWAVRELAGCIVTGEAMKGGRFFAFDIPVAYGEDIRRRPWRDRRAALLDLAKKFPSGMALVPEGHGAEFVEAVLSRGGEGVVGKPWDSPFGAGWIKCKRIQTYDVIVTETGGNRLSVGIAFGGQDAGRCPVFSPTILDNLKVGDVIEIAAQCRTARGKFREPRFIKIRKDKPSIECTFRP